MAVTPYPALFAERMEMITTKARSTHGRGDRHRRPNGFVCFSSPASVMWITDILVDSTYKVILI